MILRALVGVLEGLGVVLGRSWGRLGGILGGSWGVLGPSVALLGGCWDALGAFWAHLQK